jgi:hypothetical protein
MNLEQTPAPATQVSGWQDAASMRLHGPWLILARMHWLAIFLLTLVVFCANLVVGNYGLASTLVLVTSTSVVRREPAAVLAPPIGGGGFCCSSREKSPLSGMCLPYRAGYNAAQRAEDLLKRVQPQPSIWQVVRCA